MKYEKSKLIQIQTKDNLVILKHKIDTLIIPITILKKCEKCKMNLDTETEGVLGQIFNACFNMACSLKHLTTKICRISRFWTLPINSVDSWKSITFLQQFIHPTRYIANQ